MLVFTNRAEGLASCKGTVAEVVCTGTGFLLWQNSSGKRISFDDTATVGAGGTLGSTRMTLNSIEPVSNAVVYTSTATVNNIMENTTIWCSDGGALQSINVNVKSRKNSIHLNIVSCCFQVVVIVYRSIKSLVGTLSMQILSRQSAVVLECSFCCC